MSRQWGFIDFARYTLQIIFFHLKAKQIVLVTIPDDYQKIIIFFAGFIQTLGEQLKLRQQVIATATVFFKRFYALNPLKSIDPLLMAPTCIFLSSKVEEFGMISTRYAQYPPIFSCKITVQWLLNQNYQVSTIYYTQLCNLWWIPNSASKGLDPAIRQFNE